MLKRVVFTLAIVRYKLLDIDIIIRRSLIYGILASALASIYFLVGVVMAQRVQAHADDCRDEGRPAPHDSRSS